MNSLNGTKMTMFGKNATLKLNKTNSLPQLPAFEVDKKQ